MTEFKDMKGYSEILEYLKSLPDNLQNRQYLSFYMGFNLPITLTTSELYLKIEHYYQSQAQILIRAFRKRPFNLARQYRKILSGHLICDFRLQLNNGKLEKIYNPRFIPIIRSLINVSSLIELKPLKEIESERLIILREPYGLYGFDLQDLKGLPDLINPYTNQSFNSENMTLIQDRLSILPKVNDEIMLDLSVNMKITNLISQLKLVIQGGYNLDVAKLQNCDHETWSRIILAWSQNNLIQTVMSSNHHLLLNHIEWDPNLTPNYIELCVNMGLELTEINDLHRIERCIHMSNVINQFSLNPIRPELLIPLNDFFHFLNDALLANESPIGNPPLFMEDDIMVSEMELPPQIMPVQPELPLVNQPELPLVQPELPPVNQPELPPQELHIIPYNLRPRRHRRSNAILSNPLASKRRRF